MNSPGDSLLGSICVVEDDADLRRLLARFLHLEFGDRARVELFGDAGEAAERLGQGACDVLLTDIMLPGGDGLELVRLAKQGSSNLQAIVMTAHSTVDLLAEAAIVGASDFLMKPLERRELSERVDEALRRSRRWSGALAGVVGRLLDVTTDGERQDRFASADRR